MNYIKGGKSEIIADENEERHSHAVFFGHESVRSVKYFGSRLSAIEFAKNQTSETVITIIGSNYK